ncbi:MAG: radical SAM protein [Desulfobulbaceae bacterium]|nr:radical SAM protein [Desulfobulbaceae bacterium]
MLLIYPPVAKPCEPPAGLARLAGALRGNGIDCTLLDANLDGQLFLLSQPREPADTWSIRAGRNLDANLAALQSLQLYTHRDRYRRAVADVNRVLEQAGRGHRLSLNFANYQDRELSPLKSADLLRAAEQPNTNIFFPCFRKRLEQLLQETSPPMVGFSLNYLSQAVCTFAMVGFLKKRYPGLLIVLGGGLVTSWLRNPAWSNPFTGLVDHFVAGPGEEALLSLLGAFSKAEHHAPVYRGLPCNRYLAPGFILPYAASSGCYWNKCTFCPETSEDNPYLPLPTDKVLDDISQLAGSVNPVLIHFLDNAVSPSLMRVLAENPPGIPWYGFARISPQLADIDFCLKLRRSGCVMLKLGLESGDQSVLDAMNKGIDLALISDVLQALEKAGIATYVYLLFGTPAESISEARQTLSFIAEHHRAVTFLNLAIFNMPVCSQEAEMLTLKEFYEGDLSLYRDFIHPRGWQRREIRRFLDREFTRHPLITPIVKRDPPVFTSNHAPFFTEFFF